MKMGQLHAQQKEEINQLLTMKLDTRRKVKFFCLCILLAILYDKKAVTSWIIVEVTGNALTVDTNTEVISVSRDTAAMTVL